MKELCLINKFRICVFLLILQTFRKYKKSHVKNLNKILEIRIVSFEKPISNAEQYGCRNNLEISDSRSSLGSSNL